MIVCVFISIISISKVYALVTSYTLLGKVIYIDPGHGGVDSGEISINFLEKDMNLLLSEELEKILISKGAYVYKTRDGDYDLANMYDKNRKKIDLMKIEYLKILI